MSAVLTRHLCSTTASVGRAGKDDVIGVGDHVEVVFDHDHGRARGEESVEHAQEGADIEGVSSPKVR